MTEKRIIPCLDIRNGQVVKGTRFEDVRPVASPGERAKLYCQQGADELVFYDITASREDRGPAMALLRQVAQAVTVPLTVGGGLQTLEDCQRAFDNGADKVSINTGALRDPTLLSRAAARFDSARVVLSCDVKRTDKGFRVYWQGGRQDAGREALSWIQQGVAQGAGEVVVNAIDTDGVRQGFDLAMLSAVCDVVSVPVVASGGAGSVDHFVTLFTQVPQVAAGLGASVFHYDLVSIPALKKALKDAGVCVRGMS